MERNETPESGDPSSTPTPDFETALDEVERIIERIEAGEIGLEESLRAYKRGAELITRCKTLLEQAELQVDELTKAMLSKDGDSVTPDG